MVITTFGGAVLLPGETGAGLDVAFGIEDDRIILRSGEDRLGEWELADCDVEPTGKGTFSMLLGGENLTFTPASPSAFAEMFRVPLAAETPQGEESSEASKYDYDAAIDGVVASVKRIHDLDGDDEILSKPMIVGILSVSTAVIAGLFTVSSFL